MKTTLSIAVSLFIGVSALAQSAEKTEASRNQPTVERSTSEYTVSPEKVEKAERINSSENTSDKDSAIPNRELMERRRGERKVVNSKEAATPQ
ncbi:MAG: hypothetical protein H6601_04905 [Flavobacteriales bacterium]|nr:hypothetical protein [Flavobacteriales bacterium]